MLRLQQELILLPKEMQQYLDYFTCKPQAAEVQIADIQQSASRELAPEHQMPVSPQHLARNSLYTHRFVQWQRWSMQAVSASQSSQWV